MSLVNSPVTFDTVLDYLVLNLKTTSLESSYGMIPAGHLYTIKFNGSYNVKRDIKPEVMVITPLKSGDVISRATKISIARNKTPFCWITVTSDDIRPNNIIVGLETLKVFNKVDIKYVLPLDNNIELGRNYLDRLYNKLNGSPDHVAYAYGNLEYHGKVNMAFPTRPWSLDMLLKGNYISSNSLFKLTALRQVGIPNNVDLVRLLDWVLLIKLAEQLMLGIPVESAFHIAHVTDDNTSAKGDIDYQLKFTRVQQQVIMPFINRMRTEMSEKMSSVESSLHDEGNTLNVI